MSYTSAALYYPSPGAVIPAQHHDVDTVPGDVLGILSMLNHSVL